MAKVSRCIKKTINDDQTIHKTAFASTSTSIVFKSKRKRKSPSQNVPLQRSSSYRGVTRHRWTGRYEAHLWDKNSWNDTQTKKGRQVYLGAYDEEEAAARAYDLAALKYWGQDTLLNFPLHAYEKEVKEMEGHSKEEYIGSLRRKSSGFSRGVSKYRGVARHHHNGRWEARIGRVFGNKYLYLGTYATQEEAAKAYDVAAIQYRGLNAVTNFDVSRYLNLPASENPTDGGANHLSENTNDDFKSPDDQTSSDSMKSEELIEPEATPPRRSFPDDIQTYFGLQDSGKLTTEEEDEDVNFNGFNSFINPSFYNEFVYEP